jgi:hypothetical protein
VVRSLQGEGGRGWSTLSYSVWEETIASSEGEYTRMNLLLVYGEMPSESAYPPPDPPDFYHRYRTTVEQSSSVLYVDVETHLAEFKTPPRVSLVEALRTRVELLPYVVHNIILSFWDFVSTRDACTIAAILGGPGLPILAVLVLVPSWLALPTFWLWVVLSVLYVLLPPRAWGWMRAAVVQGWKKIAKHRQ